MKFRLAAGALTWGGVLLALTAIALTIRALTPDYASVRVGTGRRRLSRIRRLPEMPCDRITRRGARHFIAR